MNKNAILEELTNIFHDVFDDETIEVNSELNASMLEEWDSMMQINLVVAAEQFFDVKLNSSEIENLRNVGDFVDLIQDNIE